MSDNQLYVNKKTQDLFENQILSNKEEFVDDVNQPAFANVSDNYLNEIKPEESLITDPQDLVIRETNEIIPGNLIFVSATKTRYENVSKPISGKKKTTQVSKDLSKVNTGEPTAMENIRNIVQQVKEAEQDYNKDKTAENAGILSARINESISQCNSFLRFNFAIFSAAKKRKAEVKQLKAEMKAIRHKHFELNIYPIEDNPKEKQIISEESKVVSKEKSASKSASKKASKKADSQKVASAKQVSSQSKQKIVKTSDTLSSSTNSYGHYYDPDTGLYSGDSFGMKILKAVGNTTLNIKHGFASIGRSIKRGFKNTFSRSTKETGIFKAIAKTTGIMLRDYIWGGLVRNTFNLACGAVALPFWLVGTIGIQSFKFFYNHSLDLEALETAKTRSEFMLEKPRTPITRNTPFNLPIPHLPSTWTKYYQTMSLMKQGPRKVDMDPIANQIENLNKKHMRGVESTLFFKVFGSHPDIEGSQNANNPSVADWRWYEFFYKTPWAGIKALGRGAKKGLGAVINNRDTREKIMNRADAEYNSLMGNA